jgi:hypothetical protein
MQAVYQQFLADIRELGIVKGRGANAQIQAAIQCTEKSTEGVLDVGKTEEVYDAFLGGEAQAGSTTGVAREEKKDRAQRVSELRQFVKMGAIKTIDPVTLIHNAVAWVNEAKSTGLLGKGVKVYSALVDIARAQCKIPEHQLEQDEAVAAAQPKKGREKEEADYWGQVRDRIDKIHRVFGKSDETEKIMSSVQLQIDDLGGTSADRKKAKKAREALEALQGKSQPAPPSTGGKKKKK